MQGLQLRKGRVSLCTSVEYLPAEQCSAVQCSANEYRLV